MRSEGRDEGVSFRSDLGIGEVELIDTLRAVYEDGKFQLLEPSQLELNEGEQVKITVESESTPKDILALAERVYAGLSNEDMDDIERVAFERRAFFGERYVI